MSQMPFNLPLSAQVEVKIPNDALWNFYLLAVAIIITAVIVGKIA